MAAKQEEKVVVAWVSIEVYEWLRKVANEQGDLYPGSVATRILRRAYERR